MFVVGWSGKMFGLWQCWLCVPLHNYVPSSGPQYLIAAHKKDHYKIFREQYLNTNY